MLGQDRNVVSLRTAKGIQLAQFPAEEQISLQWRREQKNGIFNRLKNILR